MGPAAIEFDNVSKRYILGHQKSGYLKDRLTGMLRRMTLSQPVIEPEPIEEFWALRNVSFQIQPGEAVGIVGPNGSGKSTTLKILAGVTKQTVGSFHLNGKLGALIEVGAGFHPELSGRDNVYLNGSILGMRKAEITRKFDAIVGFAEVEKFIDTPVKHYSSGMYVRLGFSIAVHNDPEILLVDEVLAVGDLSFQRKCFDKMQEFKASGRTFILISHSMPQIASLCERAIMLKNGRLVADGLPADVAKAYVQEADAHGGRQVIGDTETGISITDVRIVDPKGDRTAEVELGNPLLFEIDYYATEPVSDCFLGVHLDRGQLRIYDTDTRSSGMNLGTLNGSGTIRCEIPDLSLVPNSYGVQAVIYNTKLKALSHVRYPHLFSIFGSAGPNVLGCEMDEEPSRRGIVYCPPAWSLSRR